MSGKYCGEMEYHADGVTRTKNLCGQLDDNHKNQLRDALEEYMSAGPGNGSFYIAASDWS